MKTNYKGILTLLLAFMVHITFAQKTITGVVSDETGPLPGVNVLIQGSNIGTETDFDGVYTIDAKVGNVLEFSFIGMETAYKKVGGSNTIDVVLEVSSENVLETVVINALGIETRQVSRTASVSKVEGAKIAESGEVSLVKGIAGKASGVTVNNSSGDPGASAYIQIRGQTSITRDLQPLFVVDGVPLSNDEYGSSVDGVAQQSRINDINPNDIANVKILKGASAAALWGSRAANGVILITTKSGKSAKKGTFTVGVTTKYSFDQPLTRVRLQDTFGKGNNASWTGDFDGGSWGDLISSRSGEPDVVNEAGAYFVAPDGTIIYGITEKNERTTYNDKNYDAIFGNGMFVDSGVSVTSRTDRGSFFASFSKLDQDGTIGAGDGTNFYTRYSGRFNSKLKINEKLDLKGSLSYSNVKSNRVQQGSNLSGLLLGLYRTPADFDNTYYVGTHYTPSGEANYNSHRAYRAQLGTGHKASPKYNNPLWTLYKQKNPNEVNRFIGAVETKYEANDWLQLIGKISLDNYTDDRTNIFPINSADPEGKGQVTQNSISYNQYNLDFLAQINKNISDDIKSYFTLGINANQRTTEFRYGSYQDFIIDSDVVNYGNTIGDNNTGVSFGTHMTRTAAFYGVADFNYKTFLMLHLTGRADQSSTFGNSDIFFYPSAELGFQFTNLKGFKSDFLNKGKIRLAYGQVGHEPAAYQTDLYYSSASAGDSYGPYYSSSAYNGSFVPRTSLPNELSPEVMSEFEVGLDLALWKNRIRFNSNYYNNETDNALLFVDYPASTGYSGSYSNAGRIENNGIEVELGVDVVKNDDFVWNVSGNWSKNNNIVTDLFGAKEVSLAGFLGTTSSAVEGEALGTLWGTRFARDDNGELILDSNGFPTAAAEEGILGDPNPDWRGGAGTSISYKGFRLNVLADASIGGETWYGTYGALTFFGRTLETSNLVTVSAEDAASIYNYPDTENINPEGLPITDIAGAVENEDGSYTLRGNLVDFGAGMKLLDEKYYEQIGGGFGGPAEQFIVDATWAKLREVTLSYSLNSDLLDKTFLNSVSFSLTGRNLYLWTRADLDFDPESNLTGSSNGRGLQYFNHPTTKSYLATISVKF